MRKRFEMNNLTMVRKRGSRTPFPPCSARLLRVLTTPLQHLDSVISNTSYESITEQNNLRLNSKDVKIRRCHGTRTKVRPLFTGGLPDFYNPKSSGDDGGYRSLNIIENALAQPSPLLRHRLQSIPHLVSKY